VSRWVLVEGDLWWASLSSVEERRAAGDEKLFCVYNSDHLHANDCRSMHCCSAEWSDHSASRQFGLATWIIGLSMQRSTADAAAAAADDDGDGGATIVVVVGVYGADRR